MAKEKVKCTKEDLYIRNPVYIKMMLALVLWAIWLGSIVFLTEDSLVRGWITVIMAVVWFLSYLQICAKRIEIHGEVIQYRNYRWRKKQYLIDEIDRITQDKKKPSKAIVYRKNGEQLFTFSCNMEDSLFALYYLEEKGAKLVKSMQCEMDYEEYYEQVCDMAGAMKDKYLIKLFGTIALRIGMKRMNYLIRKNSVTVNKLKEIASAVLPHFEIKNAKLKDTLLINRWRVNRKYEIIVSGKEDNDPKFIRFYEHCRENGLPIRESLLSIDGRPYIKKDQYICEVKERFDHPKRLSSFLNKKRKCKSLCYQAGAAFAYHNSLLNQNPRFINKEDSIMSKEKRIQRAKYIPEQFLSKKEWRDLLSEVNRVSYRAEKKWITITDEHSVEIKRMRLLLSEWHLTTPAEYDVVVWGICNYMAIVARNAYIHGKSLSPKRWYGYVEQMVAGYESVSMLSKEEHACIYPCLRLAIALQMAEKSDHIKCKNELMRLYRFLDK